MKSLRRRDSKMKCQCQHVTELNGVEAQKYAREHLEKIHVDGETWEIEYLCSETNTHLIMDFPQSELQGGGPPRLRRCA
ncbi:MAG: hypothetical protein GY755_09860 [Chloroflexi bacterium]|nr:hypothetical protein [Chloroflexota bacterium]